MNNNNNEFNRYKRENNVERKSSFREEILKMEEEREKFNKGENEEIQELAKILKKYSPNMNGSLIEILSKKLDKEYDDLYNELKMQNAEDVLNSAYEYTVKGELKDELSYLDLDSKELIMLIQQDNLLEELYHDWLDTDVPLGDVLVDSIEDSILTMGRYYHKRNGINNNFER